MKHVLIALLLGTSIGLLSWTKPQTTTSHPTQAVQTQWLEQLATLHTQLQQLEQAIEARDLPQAQRQYKAARQTFKQAEFLVAYLDPQLYERHLNESPLLKPQPQVANKEVHQPGGFQVLEEALFLETPDWEAAPQLVQGLQQHLATFTTRMQQTRLYDALIIHALKEQLLRSFTLGITGFDTPGSGQGMTDLQVVHQSMVAVLDHYKGRFSTPLIEEIETLVAEVTYTDFETFDRYGYLVGQLVPILGRLEAIREAAHLERKEELQPFPMPLNSSFTNPFQSDLLRGAYYAGLPAEEVTPERMALGKALFNDPLLSKSLQTSCATCHREKAAFTDQLVRSQNGTKTAQTQRNSPSLNYSIYADAYFYDLRAHDLTNQFDHVIHDAKEFNTSYAEILKKLRQAPNYPEQFAQSYAAYPQPISVATLNHALKCYLIGLPSFTSRFDQWAQTKQREIPQAVRQGFNLFMGKAQCATCHFPPTFSGLVPPSYTDSESEVLGVLVDEQFENPVLDADRGRRTNGIVKDNFDFFEFSFKTVSVRNVEHTAPYMHNGSIKSLEKVIEFYNLGGGVGMGLDLPHQTLPTEPLDLTDEEQQALVAFLKSLTDVEIK